MNSIADQGYRWTLKNQNNENESKENFHVPSPDFFEVYDEQVRQALVRKVMVIVVHRIFQIEICHEKMDYLARRIHRVTCHLPIDQIFDNQEHFVDLVELYKSTMEEFLQLDLFFLSNRTYFRCHQSQISTFTNFIRCIWYFQIRWMIQCTTKICQNEFTR